MEETDGDIGLSPGFLYTQNGETPGEIFARLIYMTRKNLGEIMRAKQGKTPARFPGNAGKNSNRSSKNEAKLIAEKTHKRLTLVNLSSNINMKG